MSSEQPTRPTDIVGLAVTTGPTNTLTNSTSTGTIKLTPSLNRSFLTPITSSHGGIIGGGGGGRRDDDDDGAQPSADGGDRLCKLLWQAKHTTATYCFVFWAFGMCVAFLGPTLGDLGCKTGNSISTMSWIFFPQSLFILVGSALGGIIIQRFAVNFVLLISTIMLALTLAVIPLCSHLALLALVLAVMGFFMGIIDTVANVSMIELYGKSVAPFMQALHFFYGFGAFVSPMIAEPFVRNDNCSTAVVQSLQDGSEVDINESLSSSGILTEVQRPAKIDYAFWIMALLQIPVIVMVSTLVVKQVYNSFVEKAKEDQFPTRPKGQYENVEMVAANQETASILSHSDEHLPATKGQIYSITFLTALLLFLCDGLQAVYGGYIFHYAKRSIKHMTASEAAYLNAYFWGAFAFGRLMSIIIATKISPVFMLLCNIIGCIISIVMMLIFHHSRVAIYFGTCLFGFFLSSIYPTAMSLAEQFIKVTSAVTSCIVVGAATGEMLLPVIVGHGVEKSPASFLVTDFIVALFSLFVYGAIWAIGSTIEKPQAIPGLLGALLSVFSVQPSEGEDAGLVNRNVKYYSRMRHMSGSSAGGDPEDVYGESIEINQEEYVHK